MSEPEGSWLRCRGMGRERFARLLSEYFQELGFSCTETEEDFEGRNSSRLKCVLARPNPAVPPTLVQIELRVSSTGGGCLAFWIAPERVSGSVGPTRHQRFVEEMLAHLERAVSTGSRGTAKMTRERPGALPFGEGA